MIRSGEKVVALARNWIGTPYRHQCSLFGAGTDCLGLVRGIWRDLLGAEPELPPPYSHDWSEASGREDLMAAADRWLCRKPLECAAPGDVLLFRMQDRAVAKHVGIAARTGANASFIHAYAGHCVVESSLSAPWARRVVARFSFPEGHF
jgi:NlpC/P60 family putative phage cell wall peptidase